MLLDRIPAPRDCCRYGIFVMSVGTAYFLKVAFDYLQNANEQQVREGSISSLQVVWKGVGICLIAKVALEVLRGNAAY